MCTFGKQAVALPAAAPANPTPTASDSAVVKTSSDGGVSTTPVENNANTPEVGGFKRKRKKSTSAGLGL